MFTEKKGKGYIKNKMSVNAALAYDRDEKPLSKWRKKDILGIIEYEREDLNMNLLKKLTAEQLKEELLVYRGYHHTGAFYNETVFYAVNDTWLNNLTDDRVRELIEERKQFLEDTKEERKKERAEAEKRRVERQKQKEYEEYLKIMFKYTKHKTFSGFKRSVERGKVDWDKLNEVRREALIKRKKELTNCWKNTAQAGRIPYLEDEDYLESWTHSPYKK